MFCSGFLNENARSCAIVTVIVRMPVGICGAHGMHRKKIDLTNCGCSEKFSPPFPELPT